MIRRRKDVDWLSHLRTEDLRYLTEPIDPNAWYPMETFERMGNGILMEIADGQVQAARMWGVVQAELLWKAHPNLVADGDPIETLMRFRVLRATYFDFDALEVPTLITGHAEILIRYHMGAMAEEAASYQTAGFFHRLLELAGAKKVTAHFVEKSWAGGARTLLEVTWG